MTSAPPTQADCPAFGALNMPEETLETNEVVLSEHQGSDVYMTAAEEEDKSNLNHEEDPGKKQKKKAHRGMRARKGRNSSKGQGDTEADEGFGGDDVVLPEEQAEVYNATLRVVLRKLREQMRKKDDKIAELERKLKEVGRAKLDEYLKLMMDQKV